MFHDQIDRRAQAFRDVIRDYAELPRPHNTEVRREGETGVRMHFLHLDDVIAWALHFGTPLQLKPTSMFVRASTTILVEDVFMLIWTQLDPIEAWALLVKAGYDATDREFEESFKVHGVEIPASHAFAISTLASAG